MMLLHRKIIKFKGEKVMDKGLLIQKVKELIAAPSCYPELKEIAGEWLDHIGQPDESEKLSALVGNAEACKTGIDRCIEFLKSDMGKQIYGDKVEAVLKDAEDRKAHGEDTCVCAACQACKEILKITK